MMVPEHTRRPPARTFTDDERDSFFAAFERLGSIRLAAEELGFKPMTCRHWVTLAGIDVYRNARARGVCADRDCQRHAPLASA